VPRSGRNGQGQELEQGRELLPQIWQPQEAAQAPGAQAFAQWRRTVTAASQPLATSSEQIAASAQSLAPTQEPLALGLAALAQPAASTQGSTTFAKLPLQAVKVKPCGPATSH